jgi:3-oxoacyl-[acyl-carrier-protein] synthase-3
MYLPENLVTNQDLVDKYGIDTTHDWIVQRTGIEARRFAPEGVATSDLGARAAEQAITNAKIGRDEIDMILFCSLSPDHAFPGAGCYMQAKLGLDGVPAMDIRNQCSGFIYALGTAASMVQAGAVKNVLVVGAELHSSALDLTTRGRQVGCLFGDGAGAVIVSATEEDRGIRWWRCGADGRHADVLAQKVWDTGRRPHFIPTDEEGRGIVMPEMLWAQMNGRQVFKHAVEKMIGSVMTLCQENSVDLGDIDLFFCHQANLRINQFVAKHLEIAEEKCPSNIQRYGNTTAATIPTLLAECVADGRLEPGMRVATVAFGSGFTWGSALIDW